MTSARTTLPLSRNLSRLWRHISARRRGQLGLLLAMTVLASFAEVLSIGAVLPFLGALTAPERAYGHPAAQPVIQALGLTAPGQLVLPLAMAFGVAAIVAGTMRLLLLWASTRLTFATGADLSISIYRRTLYQPYSVHVARNSSEVINGISVKTTSVIYGVIVPILTLVSAGVMRLSAWGRMMRRIACAQLIPIARAPSHWPRSIDWMPPTPMIGSAGKIASP